MVASFVRKQTMDFSLNDHQKLIRDTVRQFMENEVRPSVKQRDREGRFAAAAHRRRPRLAAAVAATGAQGSRPHADLLGAVRHVLRLRLQH